MNPNELLSSTTQTAKAVIAVLDVALLHLQGKPKVAALVRNAEDLLNVQVELIETFINARKAVQNG